MLKRFLAALLALLFVLPAYAADDDIARLYTFTSGTTIQSSQVNGEFNQIISTMNGKVSRAGVNTISGNNTHSGNNTFSGENTFSNATNPIKTDLIKERTSATGVTIDSVLLKDGMVTVAGTAGTNGTVGYASNQFQGYRNGSLKNFLMTGDVGSINYSSKTGTYTVVSGDSNYLIDATSGTWTLDLTAAATLGSGFTFYFRNSGTGIITIDPSTTETVDGQTTLTIYPGEAFIIVCDGSNFKTIGRERGLILIQSQTASASATIDFATGINSAFDEYELHYHDVLPATDNVALWLRITKDGGSTWRSTGGDYNWSNLYINSTTGSGNSTSDSEIELNRNVGNLTNEGCSGVVRFWNPSGTSRNKKFMYDGEHVDNSGLPERSMGRGAFILDANAINGIRMMFASGNIASGTFELYGVRKP